MSTHLLELRTPELHTHSSAPALPDPRAPLSLVDRASLHVGLWLLLRSTRRAQRRADHRVRAALVANERSRTAREADTLRLHQLWPRP
jgi:hypothetical protein